MNSLRVFQRQKGMWQLKHKSSKMSTTTTNEVCHTKKFPSKYRYSYSTSDKLTHQASNNSTAGSSHSPLHGHNNSEEHPHCQPENRSEKLIY